MIANTKTWKSDIEDALNEIGRPATISEIFNVVEKNRIQHGRPVTKHSKEGVRRILQSEFLEFDSEINQGRKILRYSI